MITAQIKVKVFEAMAGIVFRWIAVPSQHDDTRQFQAHAALETPSRDVWPMTLRTARWACGMYMKAVTNERIVIPIEGEAMVRETMPSQDSGIQRNRTGLEAFALTVM